MKTMIHNWMYGREITLEKTLKDTFLINMLQKYTVNI